MRKSKLVSSRLAAVLQHRQIEAIVRAETVADEVQRSIDALGREALSIAMGTLGYRAPTRRAAVADRLKAIPGVTVAKLTEMLTRLGLWSHGDAAKALAESVPRNWWAFTRAKPKVLYESMGEAPVIPTARFTVAKILQGESKIPTMAELAAAMGKGDLSKISEEEWEKAVKELLFPPPTPAEVERIVLAPNPQTGQTWTQRLESLSGQIADPDAVATQLVNGFAAGENVQELYKRMLPLTNGIQASARRVARTEGLRVAEQVQRKSWDVLGDLMVGVQILAVLDQNTRPEHAARSGTIFYREPKAGQKPLSELPELPDQPHCRCYSSPVLAEPEDSDNPELQTALTDNEKNSIPDPSAYTTWFANADVGRRKLAVGVRRYDAVATQLPGGQDPEWIDFIGEDGQLLPIDDLRDESPLDRAARKQRVREMLARREELVRQVARQGFESR